MPATPAWPPRSAPRLFVDPPLEAGMMRRLDGNAAHYLSAVMRIAHGDAVILLDDSSGEWVTRVESVGRRSVDVQVVECLRPRGDLPDLWLCFAPVKKPHFDLIIQKATELGVARIVPVLTRRCVVDKVNGERARAVMSEAAEQCARTALPEWADLWTLPQMLADWPADRKLFFADETGGESAASSFAAHNGPAAILIGPEGGFDDAERVRIRALPQACAVSLGPRILRAETAAIAATALWMATAGDWREDTTQPIATSLSSQS